MMSSSSSSSTEKNRHISKKRPDPNPSRSRPDSELRRSLRPRQTRYLADLEDEADLDEEELERGARERSRLKVPVKLPSSSSPRTMPRSTKLRKVEFKQRASSLEESTSSEDEEVKTGKRRRFGGDEDRYEDGSSHREGSKGNVMKKTIRAISGTPMPEKSDLESILDKLQKKDTYGVYAEPVDPDELPDYHDVIDHPMDFGTVRKNLANGRYLTFEQFEDDVFLICSNAMQYNAPDTIYFRQARSIQDMARKNFQEIRMNILSARTERKNGHRGRSASPEKKTVDRVSCFNPSFIERKSRWHPHNRAAPKSAASDYSNMDDKPLRTQFRIDPEVRSLNKSLHKNKIFKKPQLSSSNMSLVEKRTKKKPQSRSELDAYRSDGSNLKRIPLKKTQHNPSQKPPPNSRGSSIKKNNMNKMVKYRSLDNVSSVEKKRTGAPQYASESDESVSSDSESTSEDHSLSDLDTSSSEKTRLKEPQCSRNEPELSDTGMCSPDKKVVTDPRCSDISSGVVLASVVDNELSKIPTDDAPATVKSKGLERPMANESSDGISLEESKSKREVDVPGKCSHSESEQELSTVDTNRRATYNALDEQPSVDTDSMLYVFLDQEKELISVVPQDSDFAYARSLARFAGSLGPVAWEAASRKIKQALPPGIKFGAGWVDEVESILNPIIYEKKTNPTGVKKSGSNSNVGREQEISSNYKLQPLKNKPQSKFPADISQQWNQIQKPPQASDNNNGFTMNNNNRSSSPFGFISNQAQPQFWLPRPSNDHQATNPVHKVGQESKGVVIFPQSMNNNNISGLRSSWQGLVPHNRKKDLLPPDLNISFQPPESPAHSSSIHIESQQPDLALQL